MKMHCTRMSSYSINEAYICSCQLCINIYLYTQHAYRLGTIMYIYMNYNLLLVNITIDDVLFIVYLYSIVYGYMLYDGTHFLCANITYKITIAFYIITYNVLVGIVVTCCPYN